MKHKDSETRPGRSLPKLKTYDFIIKCPLCGKVQTKGRTLEQGPYERYAVCGPCRMMRQGKRKVVAWE